MYMLMARQRRYIYMAWHGMAFRIDISMRKCGIEGSRCI